jgi:superfamily II DNA helicase RecQ
VVLWGLPSTFCALVQREGRAGRDLSIPSDAILIVPPSVLKDNISEEHVSNTVQREALEGEALDQQMTEADAVVIAQVLDEEGVRVAADVSEGEQEVDASAKATGKRKKKFGKFEVLQRRRT